MTATNRDDAKPADGRLGKGAVLGLAAMAVGVFIIANDFTALSVAIPAIEKDFGIDLTTAQWVINGYAMVFGVLIVTGGRLADLFGRRRIFFIGAAIFALFSLLGGVAPDVWVLLASRFLMGDRRRHDVAGDPRHDLRAPAEGQGGPRRRHHPRRPPASAMPSARCSAAC